MSRSLWISGSLACLVVGAGFLFTKKASGDADAPASATPAAPAKPAVTILRVLWPTPYPYFQNKADDSAYLQATVSGNPASGGYGMVRDGGARFHEGIDIKPVSRDRKGEPADPVSAAMSGRVAYLNFKTNGPYGRYIVLEHTVAGLTVYTLYGHLAAIDPALREGRPVAAGATLGVMGHSDGTAAGFPKERAHLHFEIGLRLSDDFARWYAEQHYPDPNHHGNFNGINLTGLDPGAFFRFALRHDGELTAGELIGWVRDQPVAVLVETPARALPAILRHDPALIAGEKPAGHAPGWRVGFTADGVPVRWEPLKQNPGAAHIVAVDNEQSREARRRGLIVSVPGKPGRYTIGSTMETALELAVE